MKLSKKYRKLAKKAGFVFWKNEDYGPGKGYIDWSSTYDDEIVKFAKLIVKDFHKNLIKSQSKYAPQLFT